MKTTFPMNIGKHICNAAYVMLWRAGTAICIAICNLHTYICNLHTYICNVHTYICNVHTYIYVSIYICVQNIYGYIYIDTHICNAMLYAKYIQMYRCISIYRYVYSCVHIVSWKLVCSRAGTTSAAFF